MYYLLYVYVTNFCLTAGRQVLRGLAGEACPDEYRHHSCTFWT